MKVLITGGRYYANRNLLFCVLDMYDELMGIDHVLAGDASGADTLAVQWAVQHLVEHTVFVADWSTYGKSAGPRRNREMADANPDLVIAFPGGRGTQNMCDIASRRNIMLAIVRDDGVISGVTE